MPSTRAARAVVVDGGGQVNLARKNGLGNNGAMQRMAKRKAEEVAGDARGSRGKKRAALGEITNVGNYDTLLKLSCKRDHWYQLLYNVKQSFCHKFCFFRVLGFPGEDHSRQKGSDKNSK